MLTSIFLLTFFISFTFAARGTNPSKVPKNAILISEISTLTLRAGKKTSSRRVSPIPQLQCTGPTDVCSLFSVDLMRCKNDGSDYDDRNIQWTCSASLPEEFKLGSTDVACEGYENSQDPYVLKGSCGVNYRLLLTEKGEMRYGSVTNGHDSSTDVSGESTRQDVIFYLILGGFCILILLSALGCLGDGIIPRGGGGRGWGSDDDPPPPYTDNQPYRKPASRYTSSGNEPRAGNQQWRPGFWTGAGTGAAAGYAMGNRGRNQGGGGWFDGGPSTAHTGRQDRNQPTSRPSSSYSSSRYESSGFGSTSNR